MEKMVVLIAAILVGNIFLHPGDDDVPITAKNNTILSSQVLVVVRTREEFFGIQETAGMRTATGAAAWLLVFLAAQGGFVKTSREFVSLEYGRTSQYLSTFSVEPELEVDILADADLHAVG
jgi:hypothetical protein